jgi:hypothetical protein
MCWPSIWRWMDSDEVSPDLVTRHWWRTLCRSAVLTATSLLTASAARLDLSLRLQQEATFYLTVGCERQPTSSRLLAFDDARTEAESDLERYNAWSCHFHTSKGEIDAWVYRAVSDLHMMTTERLRMLSGHMVFDVNAGRAIVSATPSSGGVIVIFDPAGEV